LYHSVSV
jgi:Intra-flagellar transport protein 57